MLKKEVTGTTSVNGNLELGLNGKDYIVYAVQTYNSEGFNNDTMAIPYKLGDSFPVSGSPNGRWGVHVISSSSSYTVMASTQVYLTAYYAKKKI